MESMDPSDTARAMTGSEKLPSATAMHATYRPGYESLAERILTYIGEHGLQPGDRLPTEKQLAAIFQSGRTVTREAVMILSAVGQLNVRKGAGIFVAGPRMPAAGHSLAARFEPANLEHVMMLFEHRRVIEGEAARRAAALASPLQLRAVREAAEDSLAASSASDRAEFGRQDRRFHDACAAASRNIFIEDGVTNLRQFADQTDLLLFQGRPPGSLMVAARQHVVIAEAIAQGDPESAFVSMIEHVDTTRSQFESRIMERLLNTAGIQDASGDVSVEGGL